LMNWIMGRRSHQVFDHAPVDSSRDTVIVDCRTADDQLEATGKSLIQSHTVRLSTIKSPNLLDLGVPTPRIVTETLNVIRRELILDSSYTPATRMTGGQSGVDQFSDTYQFCTYFPDYTLRSKLDCEQIPRNASRLL
ncbi:hypothetical protein KCU67_g5680, partial [Aureobasidium melanogenum]